MKHIASVIAVAAFACGVAIAQPSEYFVFQNKTTGAKVCNPQPPAPSADWIKLSGPYEDPACSIKIPS